MDHEELKDLLPLAALGRLEGDEQRALDAHLATGCDECEAELRDLRETLAAMAMSEAGDGPADRIWRRLEQRLAGGEADQPERAEIGDARPASHAADRAARPGVARGWRVATAIATAAAIVLAVLTADLANRQQIAESRMASLEQQSRTLVGLLREGKNEVIALRSQLAAQGQLTRAVLAPDARMIRLGPLAPAPNAAGLVAVSAAGNHAVLQVAGLPAPPPGKEYELWWIGAKSGPVKAALFVPGIQGAATVASTLPPAGEQLLASAITLEPAGGVDKPTGAMYLKGAP
ncbi:MAG: anti-sigma factor [Candidatus Binataceae bacterium]|nr:anti-sigma factor [Candidatus Binataceae bacterium]